jgi:hypothetical protein
MIFWPHIGLAGEFDPCEEDVLRYLNRNIMVIDSILQMKVLDFVETLPSDPDEGDIYILENQNYSYTYSDNSIMIYSGSTWVEVKPSLGFLSGVESTGKLYWFNGTEWAELPMGIGDVRGPNSSLQNSIARWDSSDGKWITDSGVTLDNDNVISGAHAIYSESILSQKSYTRDINIAGSIATENSGTVTLTSSFNTLLTPITEISDFVRPENNNYSGVYILENKTGSPINVKNNTSIITGSGDDLVFEDGSTLILAYSYNTSTFNVISGGAGGGGGGGGSINWTEGSISPQSVVQFNYNSFVFTSEDAGDQEVYTTIPVPKKYQGKQITLRIVGYSSGTSDTVRMQSAATLLTPDTTVADSSANTRISSAAAITLDSTSNKLRAITLDLTDTDGHINGVKVKPGDILRVVLRRDTDTSTADFKVIKDSSEVSFA